MSIEFKKTRSPRRKSRVISKELTDEKVIVSQAVNVLMDEVLFQFQVGEKTFITDGLATCAAIAIYGGPPNYPVAFTHMSSASTTEDDQRKMEVLNHMLVRIKEASPDYPIKIVISPPASPEKHLMEFIENWSKSNEIELVELSLGGSSAVFNMNADGKVTMASTLFNAIEEEQEHLCSTQGIINEKFEALSQVLKNKLEKLKAESAEKPAEAVRDENPQNKM